MESFHLFKALSLSLILLFSNPSNATLIDRGNGMIYSDILDITFMEDANYAGSKMSRSAAQTYVDNLVYEGYDDWRLPGLPNVDPGVLVNDHLINLYLTINPITNDGTPFSGEYAGELGYLIFTEGLEYIKTPNAGQFGTIGLFDNVHGGGYWTSENYVHTNQYYEDPAGTLPTEERPNPRTPKTGFGWLVYFGGDRGPRKTLLKTGNSRSVWAVRDGDVAIASIPIPAAMGLYSIALLGLTVHTRRKTRTAVKSISI